jgi:hypothetical protein
LHFSLRFPAAFTECIYSICDTGNVRIRWALQVARGKRPPTKKLKLRKDGLVQFTSAGKKRRISPEGDLWLKVRGRYRHIGRVDAKKTLGTE